MLFKLFVSSTVLAVSLVGGCGSEHRADEGCPDEEVLAASGACCDPALAVVVDGISDCADSVARPDAGVLDAGDADGFVFPCPQDQLVDWRGECIKVSSQTDGGSDGGVNDAGECVPVVVERCPPPQERDPETGLCVSDENPDGGTECPHFECPAGQLLDATVSPPRCRDLVEACRFTCNAGQLLTGDCDCVDPTPACKTCVGALLDTTTNECVVAPICPGPCPTGEARNNAGACVALNDAWTFPCNAGAGEVMRENETCFVPPVCPGPCPGSQVRNNAGTCVTPPPAWTQSCTPDQYLTPDGQQCVSIPALTQAEALCTQAGGVWNECSSPCRGQPPGACISLCEPVCECADDSECPVGSTCQEYINGTGVCRDVPCPTGMARANDGTCVPIGTTWTFPCVPPKQLASNGDCKDPAPEARLEVSFLVPPSLRPWPQVAPAQTNAPMGTVALRNVSNMLPAEVTSLPIQLLVADDMAGSFSPGSSGTVRANERVAGCRLVEWPPATGVIGPVSPDTTGRLMFQTPLRVDTARFYDLQCSFANLDPVGTGDMYAADVLSGITAVSVGGAQRPTLSAVLGTTNGSTPTGSVSVECNYGIRRSNGSTVRVLTRPFLTRLNENAPTAISPGWVEVYAFRAQVAACDAINFQSWTWTLTATNAAPNTFLETLGANLASRLKTVDASDTTIGTWSVAASTGSGGYYLQWSPGPSWAAGSTKSLRVLVNGSHASTTLPDTIKIVPSSPNWKGVTNPSSYPTDMDDPTLRLPEGLLFTFQ